MARNTGQRRHNVISEYDREKLTLVSKEYGAVDMVKV